MKESDILYGKDNQNIYICLSQWDSGFRQNLSDLKVPDEKIKELKVILEHHRELLNDKQLKEVYCKLGYIRRDLFFRLRIKKNAGARLKNYDILLADEIKPLPLKIHPLIQKIQSRTYYALTPDNMHPDTRKYFDTGKGYGIKTEITITGHPLTVHQKKKIEDLTADIHVKTEEEMRSLIEELEAVLVLHKCSMLALKTLVKETDSRLRQLTGETGINRKIEEAVIDQLHTESREDRLHTEWKVKCTVKSTPSTLKLTREAISVYYTGGTDISSYNSIASSIKNIQVIIADISANEEKKRKDMEQSIDDFIKSSESIALLMRETYTANQFDSKATVKKIIETLSHGTTQTQGRLFDYMRLKILGAASKTTDCELKRLRYKAYIAEARNSLDMELKKLILAVEQFNSSRTDKTGGFRPELQLIKKHCEKITEYLLKNESYCERVREKLIGMDIVIIDETSLDTLERIVTDINHRTIKQKTTGGKRAILKAAAYIKQESDAVDNICLLLTKEIALL